MISFLLLFFFYYFICLVKLFLCILKKMQVSDEGYDDLVMIA